MAFKDAVDQQNPTVIEAYKIAYEDGTFDFFTSHSEKINWGGADYTPQPITRDTQEQEAAIKVGTIRTTMYIGDINRTLLDVAAIRNQRKLDRAEFFLYQIGLNDPTNNWRLKFNGFTGIVEIDRMHITAEFRDIFFLLKKNVPRDIYGESCNLVFGSPTCTVDLSTIKVSGSVGAGSNAEKIVDAARTEADDFFERGKLIMTTGTYAGISATVKGYSVGQIELMPPLPGVPSFGDQYELWPSCQKVYNGCLTYANTDNFYGFQYVPKPEQL